ncbi:unnamed protein product [Rhizoctonia solani]|uniref:TRIP4/RQT4 C2HC5-type zinc finger domain-containing protein n=1 Tax=Rhizoctonia solani TaxID=456999 RepID=A0A8H3D8W3_9AGAM|nr:unnamed protein product [Rhizoctonia solani]
MSKNKSTATAWAAGKKQGGGSLTSDLLTPRRQSPAPTPSQPKRPKAQVSPAGFPKSPEVKKLERLIDEVSTGVVDSRVANRSGCFCLARTHALSRYVPICVHCGIILCSLHNPALSCPSCSSPLLPPAARNALLLQLQEELALQLQREDERLAEEMRIAKDRELHKSGGGNFPTLTGQPEPKQNAPRKVLSIGSSGKRPTLSTFISVPSPAASNPNSGRTSPVDERIPPPPQTAVVVELDPESKLLLRQRPWVDLRDPTPMYQPKRPQQQPSGEQAQGEGGGRGRKRGRGRGRGGGGNDGARTVPGAGN